MMSQNRDKLIQSGFDFQQGKEFFSFPFKYEQFLRPTSGYQDENSYAEILSYIDGLEIHYIYGTKMFTRISAFICVLYLAS